MSGRADRPIVINVRFEFTPEFAAALRHHSGGNGGRENIRGHVISEITAWADIIMSEYQSFLDDPTNDNPERD